MLALTDSQETLVGNRSRLCGRVVAALLTILVVLVRTIDTWVSMIKATLDQAKAKLMTLPSLVKPGNVDAVLLKYPEHHLFLVRVLEKVRS